MANAKNKRSAKLPPTNWKAFVRPDLAEWEAKDPYAIASTQIKKLSEAAKSGHYSSGEEIPQMEALEDLLNLATSAFETVSRIYRETGFKGTSSPVYKGELLRDQVVELASNSAELIEKMVERDFQDMAGIAALRKDFPVMYSGFRRVWNQRLAMLNRLKLGSDSPFKSSDLGKQGPGMVLDDLRNLIEEAYWFLQSYRTSYLDDADLPPRLRKGIKSLHDLDRHTCLDWARRMAEYEIWKYGHSILPFFVNSKSATKRNLNKKKAKLLNIGTKLPPQNPSKADLTKLLVAKIRDRLKDIL